MTVETRALKRIAEGREAEIFAWEPGTVLRLLRSGGESQAPRLENEARAMRAAREAGVPVPSVHEVVVVEGRAGLVMQRCDGPDLLTELGKRPWTLVRAARITGELQARLHAVVAPPEIPPQREVIARRIEIVDMPPALRTFALRLLEQMPDGDALCHGDFHPGNIIDTADGPVLIDWPDVSRGDPEGDLARSRMLIRMGALPPGSPILIRLFTSIARSVFASRSDAAYRHKRTPDEAAVRRWATVRAADRLASRIDSEREPLLRILEDAAAQA